MKNVSACVLLAFVLFEMAFAVITIPLIRKPGGGRTRRTEYPIGGNVATVGQYYAQISLGTPAQTFALQLDTGSSDLLVYSSSCSNCPSGAPLFNAASSSTNTALQCNNGVYTCHWCSSSTCAFNDTYGDGSGAYGIVALDKFTVAGYTANITFGEINVVYKSFESATIEGIWGLAFTTLSAWGGATPFQSLVNQLSIPNQFALCLQPDNAIFAIGGGFNTSYDYTPFSATGYYTVTLTDFNVNGVSLGVPASVFNSGYSGTIVDSGTTLLLIPNTAYNALYARMLTLCTTTSLVGVCSVSAASSIFSGYCFTMSSNDIAAYPTLTVDFADGVSADVQPQAYLILNGNYYCLGISPLPDGTGTILGDVFMQGYNVLFDRANSRIGFAPASTCNGSGALLPSLALVILCSLLYLMRF